MLQLDLHKTLHTANGPLELSVQLTLEEGKILALYGKSGAGKTTLLRMIAGLEQPSKGVLSWKGKPWQDTAINFTLQPRLRPLAMVFQDYALFPNMTVKQNIAFAQSVPSYDSKLVQELLEIMEIGDLAHRLPHQLSGGQQQRVALARAIARAPQLLLLDEPLSAIDEEARHMLQDQLLHLRKRFSFTAIIVSHDLGEIFRLADEVAVLENGRIQRQGSSTAVFGQPNSGGKLNVPATLLAITFDGPVATVLLNALSQTISMVVPAKAMEGKQTGETLMLVVGPQGFEWPERPI